MIERYKFTETRTHVGCFAEVVRGNSQNQRWSVYFRGEFLGRFERKAQAVQVAERAVIMFLDTHYKKAAL